MNRTQSGLIGKASVLALLLVGPVAAQDLQQRLAAAKASAAHNQQAMRSYSWVEKTELSVKGEVKNTKVDMCRYGPDGKVLKTAVVEPAPAEEAWPQRQGRREEDRGDEGGAGGGRRPRPPVPATISGDAAGRDDSRHRVTIASRSRPPRAQVSRLRLARRRPDADVRLEGQVAATDRGRYLARGTRQRSDTANRDGRASGWDQPPVHRRARHAETPHRSAHHEVELPETRTIDTHAA